MCRRINCERCLRPSYAGCGMHVEQILGDVPPAERCRCRERERADSPNAQKAKKPSLSGRS
jgi:hypothetical protein